MGEPAPGYRALTGVKAVTRRNARASSSARMPESSGEVRPSRVTAVAWTIASPAHTATPDAAPDNLAKRARRASGHVHVVYVSV